MTFIFDLLHYTFIGSIAVRVAYYLYFYMRLAIYTAPSHTETSLDKSLSIIVCYHNEEKNVYSSLTSLSHQDYSNKTLVLVDDNSKDNTLQRLQNFEGIESKIYHISSDTIGKKPALEHGINQSETDYLLMTDADCSMGKSWASIMMDYTYKNDIVLGYAPISKSTSWVGKFSRYETWYTAVQYLSYALAGLPYMGVGRNLLYHKSLFGAVGGFDSHIDVPSGDDDLFINMAAHAGNTTICIDPRSHVYSVPKITLSSFIRQKTRHVSTSHRYRYLHKFLLSLSAASHIIMYLVTVLLLFNGFAQSTITLLVCYWLFAMSVNYPIQKKLNSMDLWLLYPMYDILTCIYYIVMIPFTFIKKQYTWS